jgi:phosphoesterase RecJ-like protein
MASCTAAVARIGEARHVLLTGHRSPDGDSLGSALALARLVEALGAESTLIMRDAPPAGLTELPGIERLRVSEVLPATFPDAFDLVVTVECPGLDRPGFADLDRRPIVNVDHHPDNARYGVVDYVDVEAAAVGEMVWRMFRSAGVTPNPDDATNLYVALATDTGDFRYSNTTPRAFRTAAEMVEAGAEPSRVAQWVHASRSEGSVRLLGEALSTLEIDPTRRFAVMSVDAGAFRRAGAGPEDTDDLVNVPRSIAGIRAVAFLKQWEPGTVRVSLRSRGALDVRRVAAAHGGGGHANAAGCTVLGELSDVRTAISAQLARLVNGEES